ncbi:hypothetical protein FACS1894158_10810 [Betaproteobacteria bacterium]|nr:hypothetical protein FACS1894158_10810 [Betaproteobacteria bacterium]
MKIHHRPVRHADVLELPSAPSAGVKDRAQPKKAELAALLLAAGLVLLPASGAAVDLYISGGGGGGVTGGTGGTRAGSGGDNIGGGGGGYVGEGTNSADDGQDSSAGGAGGVGKVESSFGGSASTGNNAASPRGGNGGAASASTDNNDAYDNIYISGGSGGDGSGSDIGGNGGNASLTVTGTLRVNNSLNLNSGNNGSGGNSQGMGGKASLTAGTLQIGAAGTTLTATGFGVGDTVASITNLLLTGGGNFILNGVTATNVSVGQLVINGGTLWDGTGGSGNWDNLVGGGLSYSTTDDITLDTGGATIDLSSNKILSLKLTGPGGLTKDGAGTTLTLNGNNIYTGKTTVNAGTLAGNIAAGTDLEVAANATYDGLSVARIVGALTGVAGSNIKNTAGLTVSSGTFGGDIDATNTYLTKEGAGTTLTLTGTNTYTGKTTVNAGTLKVQGTLGSGGDYAEAIANNSELVFDQNTSQTLSGIISGNGGLTKDGAPGTILTLNKINTYDGDTKVNAGTLALTSTGSLNSSVSVASVATFDLSGTAGKDVSLQSGGTLNWHQGGSIGGNLNAAGGILNFYVPDGTTSGTTLLNVAGNAYVTNSQVHIGLLGTSTPLTAGDHIVLIDASGTLSGAPDNPTASSANATAAGMQGISLIYTFDISTTATQLIASLPVWSAPLVNPQHEALAEGYLAGLLLANQGADIAAGQGMANLLAERGKAYATFATLVGGNNRYKTGSHIDMNSSYLMTGVAGDRKLASGDLTLGLFIEAGEGDFDTSNHFANAAPIKGKGDARYVGAGLMTRLDLAGAKDAHPYLEGSLRAGRVKSDFKANFGGQVLGTAVPYTSGSYDSRSAYQSLHVGGGYVWTNKSTELDVYGQYLYGQRDGDTVRLSSGEKVHFDAIASHRARIGARATWTVDNIKPYAGIAYEHEFDGKAKAKIDVAGGQRYKIDAPDVKGDTGILELGFTVQPTASKPLTVDFNVKGYAGRREGFTGGVRAEYRF